MSEVVCGTCPRHCRLEEGATGFCRARKASEGRVVAANYGKVTSLALDPIEKKPMAFFHPGSKILSVGSFGCNLRCPFCQNDSISQCGEWEVGVDTVAPAQLADLARRLGDEHGNVGVAYTYNEPLVGWEFERDAAKEVHTRGMLNVLVSNGCAEPSVIEELARLIDAANIDLKGPSQEYYDWVGGSFDAVCRTIKTLHSRGCHVEVTALVVPGRNDRDEDMLAIATFLASVSPNIPLHVTRFFPRFQMQDSNPTPVSDVYRLADVARQKLTRVLTGNC